MTEWIKVCSITFASENWGKRKLSVMEAVDTGRLRGWQLQGNRWWIAVDDLNRIWGDKAPRHSDYLYIASTTAPSNLAPERPQLSHHFR